MTTRRYLGARPDVKRREQVAKLRAKGFSLRQIGERIGVSKQAVSSLMHYAGIGAGPVRQVVLCNRCRKPVGPAIGPVGLNEYTRHLTCVSCVAKDHSAPFGVRLRALRLAAGVTLAELASRSGVRAGRILYWEWRGKRPDAELVRRVADALGVEARILLNGAPT